MYRHEKAAYPKLDRRRKGKISLLFKHRIAEKLS